MKTKPNLLNKLSRRFKKEKFGESYKECCNYANTDCNKAGGKDDIVTLAVSISCFRIH